MPKTKEKVAAGTGYTTGTMQHVHTTLRLVLRKAKEWPKLTELRVVDADGVETPLLQFNQDGTFSRFKDVYVRGLTTDLHCRLSEKE